METICTVIDTFPAYMEYWACSRDKPMQEQIDAWAHDYLSKWPGLLELQIADYVSQGLDWRQIARTKIFPHLGERLADMQSAHAALLEWTGPVFSRAKAVLGFEANPAFVIHVGIGCGAGWVTELDGRPAILFGLENIAESGWSDPETIRGLAAHEIGHLCQHTWRAQHGKPIGDGPWWQLVEEGFANTCESLACDTESVHQNGPGPGNDWLDWCREHAAWLAAEFLRAVEAGEPVNHFFGSWLEVRGRSETGYFLGQEVVAELHKQYSLKEIALLEPVEAYARPVIKKMAERTNNG
jgi:hypothetical protein